jgi:hypothetical protein
MGGLRFALVLCLVGPTITKAADKPPDASHDFKLVVRLFGAGKDAIASAELVVRGGVGYQFVSEVPEEVVIIDPARARVSLIDLARKLQTELTSQRLDAALAGLHRKKKAAIEAQEKAGGRASRVFAGMSRDLVEPSFRESYDPSSHRLRLNNPSVDVDALGEPEADKARLVVIVNCLAAVAKLTALRDPTNITPFTRLDALRAVATEHGLRPKEMTFLYRLAGPPQRLRWTYQLVPALTDREREAIARVDRSRANTPFVPYEEYERAEDD